MDGNLQNHAFGGLDVAQESSGAPIGVDEAEVMMGEGAVSTSDATRDQPSMDAMSNEASKQRPGLPTRPGLSRDSSTPAPSQPPPPPAPLQSLSDSHGFEDSSALDMTKLAQELPATEPSPYAFVYQDTNILPEELEEWFSYSNEEQERLYSTREQFTKAIAECIDLDETEGSSLLERGSNWTSCSSGMKLGFVKRMLHGLETDNINQRRTCLGALSYLAFGAWYETAGMEVPLPDDSQQSSSNQTNVFKDWQANHSLSLRQLQEIEDNVRLLVDNGALLPVYHVLRTAMWRECSSDSSSEADRPVSKDVPRQEVWACMTILYFCLEVIRASSDQEWSLKARSRLFGLHPDLLAFMSEVMDKMRWDDTIELPLTKLLLLYWKALLVLFGGSSEATEAKMSFVSSDLETSDSKGYPIITASPLDYHLFRQEISAKYPAYNPPPPLFPLEPENNSILPPLRPSLAKLSDMNAPGLANIQGHSTSLLHQPIHIATPAPSPPPSPAIGGKGGKKMNYQTNNQFPFLYPPLDETSNRLGGKGSTDLQDLLVGRKWEGPDIPASILEAAELFARRMRATRGMKQLWEERVEFVKYERGWKGPDDDVADLGAKSEEDTNEHIQSPEPRKDSIEDRLQVVEDFYRNGLPHLQSVVMVLLKVILSNVTTLITQMNGQNGLQTGFQFQEGQNGDTQHKADTTNGINGVHHQAIPPTNDELDSNRNQEITAKAVSGILITLLKWFKVSHILKFEYMTQLLVDANYIPLILKLMQTQEVERIVNYRSDARDLSFFHLCLVRSHISLSAMSPTAPDDETSYIHQSSSEDEAAPPPIRRNRSPPKVAPPPPPPPPPLPPPDPSFTEPTMPLVDELGIPTTALPSSSITTFSQRNFYSSITLLRILRKVCAKHAHRNLLLVSYKSTPLLRRALKVPQPELRKCALKLVKAQVPFCGRKWRQGNMRIITAVWLSIRPELRDEWLAGGDVDAVVEESVPREQAIRGLVHWWHLRKYWDVVGPPATLDEALGDEFTASGGVGDEEGEEGRRKGAAARTKEERKKWLEEENDFFRKELERMEWNWTTGDDLVDEADQQAAQQAQGQVWDAGVQMDGW